MPLVLLGLDRRNWYRVSQIQTQDGGLISSALPNQRFGLSKCPQPTRIVCLGSQPRSLTPYTATTTTLSQKLRHLKTPSSCHISPTTKALSCQSILIRRLLVALFTSGRSALPQSRSLIYPLSMCYLINLQKKSFHQIMVFTKDTFFTWRCQRLEHTTNGDLIQLVSLGHMTSESVVIQILLTFTVVIF